MRKSVLPVPPFLWPGKGFAAEYSADVAAAADDDAGPGNMPVVLFSVYPGGRSNFYIKYE